MQSDTKEIYKLTSERKSKAEKIYKDVGNFVFAELYSTLRRPKSLITKLKGIGYWYLRRKRLKRTLSFYPEDYDINLDRNEFETDYQFLNYENKREIYKIFKEREIEYDEYMTKKLDINRRRNEFKTLLQSSDREVEGEEQGKV